MITFVALCAVMALAAVVPIARQLLRKPTKDAVSSSPSRVGAALLVIAMPLAAVGLYVKQSNWSWEQAEATATRQATIEQMVVKLEQRLQQSPDDLQGWLMLGRSYLALDKANLAVDAYRKAYALGGETNTEAALGLGEALVLVDEASLRGQAGGLFEAVLKREPANPSALWYGSVAALAGGNLPLARQRIATLLSLNPPQQVRDILERQLQDIDQQLGAPQSSTQLADATPRRSLTVKVSLAPALAGKFDQRTPLFILARDGAGPPLAAIRRVAGDLPLTVTLSDRDAMIVGRSIADVAEVTVVARVSQSGAPQAQSGDLFGEVRHRFDSQAGTVEIVIDRTVP